MRWIIRKKLKFRFSRTNAQEEGGKSFLKNSEKMTILYFPTTCSNQQEVSLFFTTGVFFFTHNITCIATTYLFKSKAL
jgi:hypothetical protein